MIDDITDLSIQQKDSMRKDPLTNWSNGLGEFAWPKHGRGQEATLGLFYSDTEELQQDYQRVTHWQNKSHVHRSVSTLHLEKTTCGQAWLDLGARHYLKSRTYQRNNRTGGKYFEPLDQRIAVPIHFGGQNRRLVANRIRSCTSLTVIFASYDGQDPEALVDAINRLRQDCLGTAPSTQLVQLRGLSTLSKFHPTQGGRSLQK